MPTVETYKPTKPQRLSESTAKQYKHGDPFYSSRKWRRFRRWYLARNPLCVECLKQNETKAAEHVHHDKPRKDYPALAFDETNMEALCHSCHSKLEAERRRAPPHQPSL